MVNNRCTTHLSDRIEIEEGEEDGGDQEAKIVLLGNTLNSPLQE
jgi:hypothetical protein